MSWNCKFLAFTICSFKEIAFLLWSKTIFSLLTIEFENKIWTKHFVESVSGMPKEKMGSTDQMVLVSVWKITYAYET